MLQYISTLRSTTIWIEKHSKLSSMQVVLTIRSSWWILMSSPISSTSQSFWPRTRPTRLGWSNSLVEGALRRYKVGCLQRRYPCLLCHPEDLSRFFWDEYRLMFTLWWHGGWEVFWDGTMLQCFWNDGCLCHWCCSGYLWYHNSFG